MPPKRRDHVDQEERVTLAPAERFDVVPDPGRGLGMHDRDDRGRRVGGEEAIRVDGLAPGRLDRDHVGTQAGGHLAHALTEHPVHPDDDGVAGPDEIDEGGLHAARPRRADRQGQWVGGGEDATEAFVGAVEQGEELRVEVPDHRAGERHRHFGVRVRGSRPHQQAFGHPHRRIVTGPRSAAPTRQMVPRGSGRLPVWNGCSSLPGSCHPSVPTSRKIQGRTTPGFARARTPAVAGGPDDELRRRSNS